MCGLTLSGRGAGPSLGAALDAIDAANSLDPTTVAVRGAGMPLALAHGRLADEWVCRLMSDADDALRIAARAHHLRRWELPRAQYAVGRPGYLKWRRDQKLRHARDVEVLLVAVGYGAATIGRVRTLIRRDDLSTDPTTKTLEDAACLVFLETQLSLLAARLDHPRLVEVIRKTAAKMTAGGLALVDELPLSDDHRSLLAEALG